MSHLGRAAIEVFRDESEFVAGLDLDARAHVARHQPLGECGNLLHRLQHALAQHVHERDRRDHSQHRGADESSARASGKGCGVVPIGMGTRVIRQAQDAEER